MTNAFVSTNTFNLSRLEGMNEEIIARLVPLTIDGANKTGVGKRAIIANPGCSLLLPDKEGNLLISNERRDRGDISLLRLGLAERRGQYVVEFREDAFYIDIPVTIDRGQNYRTMSSQDRITYTVHFLISIDKRGVDKFLTSFGLSTTQPTITIQMISDALAKSIVAISGEYMSEMGEIDARALYRTFNTVGLYIRATPTITGYTNTRGQALLELAKKQENSMSKELEEFSRRKAEMIQQGQAATAQLMCQLANSELEKGEIERILEANSASLRNALNELDGLRDQVTGLWQERIREAKRRAGIDDRNRPDRPPRLPYSSSNCLGSGDDQYGPQRYPSRNNDRQGYYGQRRDPYPRDQYSQYPREQYPTRSNNFRQPQAYYRRNSAPATQNRPSDTSLAPYKPYQSDRYYTRQDSYRPDYQRPPHQNNNNWNRPAAPAQNKFGPRQG